MTPLLGCIICQIDPQSLSLAVPAAQATLIAVPFFLRSRIRAAVVAAFRQRRPEPRTGSVAEPQCPRPGAGGDPAA